MMVFIAIEASQLHGDNYRLAIGCKMHPSLVSMIATILRWF